MQHYDGLKNHTFIVHTNVFKFTKQKSLICLFTVPKTSPILSELHTRCKSKEGFLCTPSMPTDFSMSLQFSVPDSNVNMHQLRISSMVL